MKRVMSMLLSFVVLFTALFSHVPMIISAEETDENEISIQETLPGEEKTEEDENVVLEEDEIVLEEENEQQEETVIQEEADNPAQVEPSAEEETENKNEEIDAEMEELPQETAETQAETENEFTATQNPDTGDVTITTDNTELLDYMADPNNNARIYFDSGDSIRIYRERNDWRYVDYYYEVVSDNSGNQYILIPFEVLRTHNIASGDATVHVNYNEKTYSDEIPNLRACESAPVVTIKEVENGLLITSEDPAFLNAVVEPKIGYNENEVHNVQAKYGSYLSVLKGSDEWNGYRILNEKWHYSNSTRIEEYLILESGGVLITEDALKRNNAVNGSGRYVRFNTVGYESFTAPVEGELTLGCTPLPESGISDLDIYQNDDGDIIINSSNKEWLRTLTERAEYGPESHYNKKGGTSIEIRYDDNGNGMYFSNQLYSNGSSETDLFYDEDSDYVYIPYETVIKDGGQAGKTYNQFYFRTYGYENYDLYSGSGKTLTLSKGNQSAPTDIEIYEDDNNGDICVHSSNTEWMEKLVESVYDNNGRFGVWVEGINGNNNRNFSNTYWNKGRSNDLIYKDGIVRISNERILESHVSNGIHRVWIRAFGYTQSEYLSLELHHACKEAPADVNVEENSDGDLEITSVDTQWLEALANSSTENRSMVEIINENGEYVTGFGPQYRGSDRFEWREDRKAVLIPHKSVLDMHLANGKYRFSFYTHGYESFLLDDLTEITQGCKKAPDPEDVTIESSLDKIVISCSDADWLKALAEPYTYDYDSSTGSQFREDGGRIRGWSQSSDTGFSLQNQVNSEDGKEYRRYTYYEVKDNTITLNKDILIRYRVGSRNYRFTLTAKGYSQIEKEIDVLTSLRTDLPQVDVVFDGNDILISSTDETWLDGVMKMASNRWNEGGYIECRRYIDGNWNNTWSFTNYENYNRKSYVREGNTIRVPKNSIVNENKMPTGDYELLIGSYGYADYITDEIYHIEGVKNFPSGVEIKQNETGDLIIKSPDKEFLKALELVYKYDKDWNALSYGSSIRFNNYHSAEGERSTNNSYYGYFSNEEREGYYKNQYITYDTEKEYAIIKASDLKTRFLKTGYYYVYVGAAGYEDGNYYDVPLHIITGGSGNMVLGTQEQLEIAGPGETVTWTSSNDAVLKIDNNGVVKASGIGTAVITAKVYKDGTLVATDTLSVTVVSGKGLKTGIISDIGTVVNVGDVATLTIDAESSGADIEHDQDSVKYTSLDTSKAVVEGRKVTFIAAGTVKIESLVAEKKNTITFTVYSVPQGLKLSAVLSDYDKGYLETGDESTLTVKTSEGNVSPEYLEFKSSNAKVATVNEQGKVLAGAKGSATITATVMNDPGKRKVTFAVKVENRVAKSLTVDVENNAAVIKKNENGIYIDYTVLSNTDKIKIVPLGKDKNDFEFVPGEMSYVSTDTGIATVDKNGVVTFKKDGQVTITCTVKSNPKDEQISKDIILRAINYAPKIESRKITYNKYYSDDIIINVHPVYDSEIADEVKMNDTGLFTVSKIDNNHVKITLKDQSTAAKAYNETLTFKVNGHEYSYKVTVTVSTALPAVTVKNTGTFNRITAENSLEMKATAKNAEIRKIVFVGGWADFDAETGSVTLKKQGDKVVSSGTVRFYFDGYTDAGYTDKKVSFKTVAKKPTVKLQTSSATLYVPEGSNASNKEVVIRFVDGKKNPINIGNVTVSGLGSSISAIDEDGYAIVKIKDLNNGTIIVSYKEDPSWIDTIDNKLSVKIIKTTPTAKLAAATINHYMKYQDAASIAINCSAASEQITKMDVLSETKPDDSNYSISCVDGKLIFKADKEGTYKLTLAPYIAALSEPLKSVTLTVKVVDDDPKITFKTGTLKLDRRFHEVLSTDLKMPTTPGFDADVTGVVAEPLSADVATIKYDAQNKAVTATVKNGASAGNYVYNVYPLINGVKSSTPIKLTIALHERAALNVSAKGALNQLNRNSEVIATLKLSNYAGEIESVAISGNNNLISEIDEDGKLVIRYSDTADLSKIDNGSMNVNVVATTDLGDKISKTITIKTSRKAPTLKLNPSTVNVYDTSGINEDVAEAVFVLGDFDAKVRDIEVSKSLAYEVRLAESGGRLIVKLIDGAKLKSGSTQNFTVKIVWEGDLNLPLGTIGLKMTTIKVPVKDASYLIKTK